jgi:hypothetical protein
MVLEKEEDALEPVSPTGQYFNSSALNVSVLGVLETEVPIDDSKTIPFLMDVFLPINPRFSSIMVLSLCQVYVSFSTNNNLSPVQSHAAVLYVGLQIQAVHYVAGISSPVLGPLTISVD